MDSADSQARLNSHVERFRDRSSLFRERVKTASRHAALVAGLRLLTAGISIGSFIYAVAAGGRTADIAVVAAGIAAALFALLIVYHDRLKARVRDLGARAELNELALLRIERNWSRLPRADWGEVPADHPYALDLDVFGSASLVQLIPPVSVLARRTLRSWLLEAAHPADILSRQRSIAELRDLVTLREDLAAQSRRIVAPATVMDNLQSWADSDGSTQLVSRAAWVAGSALAVAVALAVAESLRWVVGPLWVLPLAVGRVALRPFTTSIRDTVRPLAGRAHALGVWSELARTLSGPAFESEALQRVQESLGRDNEAAWLQIRRLGILAEWAAVRASPTMHLVLQVLVFWDVWIATIAVRWRRANGGHVRQWFSAISTGESLAALGSVASENPDWTFPELSEPHPAVYAARGLGHPLLPAVTRVSNDVSLGPDGTLVLVTGSNMAGKSTFLRAIGTNLVLAQMGSAVCAEELRLSQFRLFTVVRVTDSLERGVSYFMAELQRLKQAVDAASTPDPRPLLYLFDEILQGTNSAERLIAARRVLLHLISAGAVGVVNTHDLTLADAPAFEGRVRHVHFQEQIQSNGAGTHMTFDYRARTGKATSTNALKLLALVGLGDGSHTE
jgi:hypothetical protein